MKPTPERSAKIGDDTIVERERSTTCPHCGSVVFSETPKCPECRRRVVMPDPLTRHFDQWPLKRLHVRGIVNDVGCNAGQRYYQHWYASGLSPLGALDFGRVGGSAEPNVGMAASERQAYHRQQYRIGDMALGPALSPYVNAIVLYEEEPELVGRRLTGRNPEKDCRIVAIEFLKAGLNRLADAYGLTPQRY